MAAKALKSAATVGQKWVQNIGAATTSMTNGANAVTDAPGAKAAAAAPKMLARVTAAIQSGKYAARVSSVSAADWKSAYINKGIPRVAQGAQASLPKYNKFLNDFLPVAHQVSVQVDGMPKNTIEDSVARAGTAIRAFADWGKNRK